MNSRNSHYRKLWRIKYLGASENDIQVTLLTIIQSTVYVHVGYEVLVISYPIDVS